MTATQHLQRPRRGWAGTGLRRAARRLGYIHHELVLANQALFRPVGAPRARSAGRAGAPWTAGERPRDTADQSGTNGDLMDKP